MQRPALAESLAKRDRWLFHRLPTSLYRRREKRLRDTSRHTYDHDIRHTIQDTHDTTLTLLFRYTYSPSSLTTFQHTFDTLLSRSETADPAIRHSPPTLLLSACSPRFALNLQQRTVTYFDIPQRTLAHRSAKTPLQAMDSMRHLSSSLPSTRRRNEQTYQLLSDFKAAALSVTNLYKTATAENARSRDAGYQDALDDLLVFLDKENLGLMDGEGWKVRQWATERLDDAPKASEDDEESSTKEEVVETRSSSPEVQRKPIASNSLIEEEQQRPASEPPQHAPLPTPQQQSAVHIAAASPPTSAPVLDNFSFRSAQAYPTNHDRDDNQTMDLDPTSTAPARPAPKASSKPRHTAHNRSRDNQRASSGPTFNFNLGTGAGGKRKMPYPDFFDISGLNPDGNDNSNNNNRREGGGRGGKKGRHV